MTLRKPSFRWYALGVRAGGRVVAGLGLAPERVDDEALKAWGAWCDAKRLGCGLVKERRKEERRRLELQYVLSVEAARAPALEREVQAWKLGRTVRPVSRAQ